MKRFRWLWWAIAGAVGLPLLTTLSQLLRIASQANIFKDLDTFAFALFSAVIYNPGWIILSPFGGFVLGALSVHFWRERSLQWRAIGAGVGVATTALAFGALWLRLETPVPEPGALAFFYLPLKEQFLLLLFAMAPTLLWAWALVFAAPFLRSSSQSRALELFLWMAAGSVAGAVLLPLATGTGANLFLLQTRQTRAWIGTLVSLFWVELPLTGAVFGALCAALVQGRRGRVLCGACVLFSLGVAGLTWQRAQSQSSNWPALDALIAAPTTLRALGLLFFSLVARSRSALLPPTNTG